MHASLDLERGILASSTWEGALSPTHALIGLSAPWRESKRLGTRRAAMESCREFAHDSAFDSCILWHKCITHGANYRPPSWRRKFTRPSPAGGSWKIGPSTPGWNMDA